MVVEVNPATTTQPPPQRVDPTDPVPVDATDATPTVGAMPSVDPEAHTTVTVTVLEVTDSLGALKDDSVATQRVLDGLAYEADVFTAVVNYVEPGREDWGIGSGPRPYAHVLFPSAKPAGIREQDTVRLWWYAARNESGEVVDAPAVLVIHSMLPTMQLGKATAVALSQRGFHTFMMEMPGYGSRRGRIDDPGVTALSHGPQAVADARRARDVVLAAPHVQGETVAIQGLSLGGFLASDAAAMDGAFEPVLLLLSGGDAAGVLRDGIRDAAVMRQHLAAHGYRGDRLDEILSRVEPLMLAHRLDPDRTWLWSAIDDRVVPTASSDAFAKAAGLDPSHHLKLGGNHYSSMFALPQVVGQFEQVLRGGEPGGIDDPNVR